MSYQAISYQPSAVSRQRFAISCQPSAICERMSCQLSAVSDLPSASPVSFSRQRFAVPFSLLAFRSWLFALSPSLFASETREISAVILSITMTAVSRADEGGDAHGFKAAPFRSGEKQNLCIGPSDERSEESKESQFCLQACAKNKNANSLSLL
jgi:hypothetical protein